MLKIPITPSFFDGTCFSTGCLTSEVIWRHSWYTPLFFVFTYKSGKNASHISSNLFSCNHYQNVMMSPAKTRRISVSETAIASLQFYSCNAFPERVSLSINNPMETKNCLAKPEQLNWKTYPLFYRPFPHCEEKSKGYDKPVRTWAFRIECALFSGVSRYFQNVASDVFSWLAISVDMYVQYFTNHIVNSGGMHRKGNSIADDDLINV